MPTKQPHSPRGSRTTTGLPWLAAAALLLAFGAAADRLAAEVVEWTVREGAAAR